ncbi:metal-dependent transcriptional regulator [Thermoflexus sp.]|uniref:metal-dependent transcriptional regulator n=1 Tax=Thermoflexus sp. TaxID=1969742 RepID=UPI002ADDF244|nr:metal-dependent transcriptional regulator [Thermoflexus sp.]
MPRLSASMEDYLRAIYILAEREGTVTTTRLAEYLHVAPPSVTGMLKKLARLRLVHYAPYRGVTLTRTGRRIALEVIRHHRLLELFLMEALGYDWDEVHAEADRLEHAISEALEERIATMLGHPAYDPHGDPIPTRAGEIPLPAARRLSEVPLGVACEVLRVIDEASTLRQAARAGLRPGAQVIVEEQVPGVGLRIRVGDQEHRIRRRLAEQVFVRVPPLESSRETMPDATTAAPDHP